MQEQLDEVQHRQKQLQQTVNCLAKRIPPGTVASASQSPKGHQNNTPAQPTAGNQRQEMPTTTEMAPLGFISGVEADTYLLGGNKNMVRYVQDYRASMLQVHHRKHHATEDVRGRLLCLNLLKREVPKEEMARKNITGNSRDENNKKCRIAQIDPEILHSIFQPARMQNCTNRS